MQRSTTPATLVICATVPEGVRAGTADVPRRPDLPVTWLASGEQLVVAAGLARQPAGDAVALRMPRGAGESRQRLRGILTQGRAILPDLAAVAIPGPVSAAVRALLVEEGIRVAVVESLGPAERGSRRPAPPGWRCRNAAWGLWEVEIAAARPAAPLSWLGFATMPRPRRRSLHVLRTEGVVAASTGGVQLSHRLERWLGWAGRHVERGTAEAISLPRLASRLAGHDAEPGDRSVLRAA